MTVAVIVAAGAGTRLGGVAKALLAAGDRTFLARIAATARAAGVARGIVVVGPPHGEAVGAAARELGLEVVTNPEPARGMATSVALGFAAASATREEVALLWPVDHPHVVAATIAQLLAALAAAPAAVAAIPTRDGRGGHPPAIRRALWPALATCGGEPDGARGVLAAAGAAVVRIEVDDAGVIRDVDLPEDLRVRRASLAGLAAVALAGCPGGNGGNGPPLADTETQDEPLTRMALLRDFEAEVLDGYERDEPLDPQVRVIDPVIGPARIGVAPATCGSATRSASGPAGGR